MRDNSHAADLQIVRLDNALFEIETQINWLHFLSPTQNATRWQQFKASNFTQVMPLTYPENSTDFRKLRSRLKELDFEKVDNSLVAALLKEKAQELDLFIDLICQRDTDGFLATSIALFGGTEAQLLEVAEKIIEQVPGTSLPEPDTDAAFFYREALKFRTELKAQAEDFDYDILLIEDLNSSLMVNNGHLYIDSLMKLPQSRVQPLLAHEMGVHMITRYNGRCQAIRQLESGLAHYDTLQEGLATLCEYLTGFLPPQRLRVLAGRVLAVNLAIKGEGLNDIFFYLRDQVKLNEHLAFDTAVRALRGGGLTKDAVYLKGLIEVLAYAKHETCLDELFIGKFSLKQVELIKALREQNYLIGPRLLPSFLKHRQVQDRLNNLKDLQIYDLYQRSPET